MNKNRKMKDIIGSKMVQANPKITEKSMKKSRSRKAESGTDKEDEKNNLTRTWSRDPMLAWTFPISNILALNQTIANELAKLIFSHCWSRPDLLSSPHRHEFLIFNNGERCFLIDKGRLGLTRWLLPTHILTKNREGSDGSAQMTATMVAAEVWRLGFRRKIRAVRKKKRKGP